jgi:hypothetical protein
MAQTLNYTRIPAPRVSLVDPQTGIVANEWFRFFNNLYSIAYSGANTTTPGTYGSATNVAQVTIDAYGGITNISNVPIAIDATQIVSGNINTARIQGAYTGVTGVGTLTSGTWNATSITTSYGGTGLTSYAVGDLSYYASGTALSKLAIGSSTYMLTSSGTAPQWTNPTTITVGKASNLVGGAANRIAYQTAADTTSFIAAPTVSSTYLYWDGATLQWSTVPTSMVYPGAGIANSTGSAWGTSYGVTGTAGSVVLSIRPTMSVTGAGFTLQDATDATKQANFDLSTLTTGTTYSYKLPVLSGSTLAVLGLAQTWTAQQIFSGGIVVSLGQPATLGGNVTMSTITGVIVIGSSQTTGTVTIGNSAQTGTLTFGQSTAAQTVNIATGITAAATTKAVNIGTAGNATSTTNIAIGSTTGTSTTTVNGLLKLQTYLVANLPTGSAGAKSFVTDALTPTFGSAVVGGGAVGVPVYHDGTSWKVG